MIVINTKILTKINSEIRFSTSLPPLTNTCIIGIRLVERKGFIYLFKFTKKITMLSGLIKKVNKWLIIYHK
ncbi:hypothetical protein PMEGAPR236_43530 [Priestia megaterium]